MWGGGGNKILLDTNKTDMRNQAVREVNHAVSVPILVAECIVAIQVYLC